MSIKDRDVRYYPLYGDTVKVHAANGITLSETVYPPGLSIPLHTHEEHGYFSFVLRGGYFESARKRTHECGPLALTFHPPGAAHSNHFHNRKSRLFNIRLDADWLDQICEHESILATSAILECGLLTQLATKVYQEFSLIDVVSSTVIEDLVIELLTGATRSASGTSTTKAPQWLRKVQDVLRCQFNQSLRLADIAADVGVHRVHLSRAFRQQFHCTIGEYIRFLRVELACRQLSTSRASLLDITLECGFSDQSHFCRTFRRFTGLTPLQYRAVFRRV